jgi:hypothetical protein
MTTFRLVGAVAALVTIIATPVWAQPVITNPGKCAQYYPNANCQNYGAGNPYTNGGYFRDNGWRNGNARMYHHRQWHRHHHRGY